MTDLFRPGPGGPYTWGRPERPVRPEPAARQEDAKQRPKTAERGPGAVGRRESVESPEDRARAERSAARRRLRSRAVRIGMVSALSLALVSCSSDETTAYCVEEERPGFDLGTPSPDFGSPSPQGGYREVPEYNCDDDDDTTYRGGSSYFWYYGGSRSNGYVTGGSTVRPEGKITTPSGRVIQRGGFGGRGGGGG